MEPIISIEYYTQDPVLKNMIDMYWATNEDGTNKYKNADFVKAFGMNTQKLSHKIIRYYKAYCIYDICPKCKKVQDFLKKRHDKYLPRKNFWGCFDCRVIGHKFQKQLLSYEQLNEGLEEALLEGSYHTLSFLQLSIFKALIQKNCLDDLNEQFGMSKMMFLKYVNELQELDLLRLEKNSNHVFILDEYKGIFKNDLPERKVKSIFGENNFKMYQQLKRKYPYVFPEISICAFIKIHFIDHLFTAKWHKNYFLTCRVDALVCEYNGEPRFAVEFQGSYHTEPEQKERDELKKLFLQEVEIPINYYTYKDLK